MRVPSLILKYPPMAFATEPNILPANKRFTSATRGASLSSCQERGLPASKAVPAACKYSGEMSYFMTVAAAFAGLRSVDRSVKTNAGFQPSANGGLSTNPTAFTPGIVSTASLMRFCIAGTSSPLYPAMARSVFHQHRVPRLETEIAVQRADNPRTATSEEVTSTAQMAICTTSSRSRTVIRRPAVPADPAFNDLVRIGPQHLAHRNNAEEESAHQRQNQSDCINISRPGSQGHAWEIWVLAATRSASATARRRPTVPASPPISEISTASVNSVRRMRLRLDPSARRRATSRPRSAARAANRLPRLAQAASRIKPASSINAVTNARADGQKCRQQGSGAPVKSSLGRRLWDKSFSSQNPIELRSAAACAGVTPGFRCPIT